MEVLERDPATRAKRHLPGLEDRGRGPGIGAVQKREMVRGHLEDRCLHEMIAGADQCGITC